MPIEWVMVLAAVVAGWVVQLLLTLRQTTAFTTAVRTLRTSGTVSIGVSGKRYRGGRAYVAIAVDDHGIIRDALSLRGFTTFARAQPAPALVGVKLNQVAGDRDIAGLTPQLRASAREAALLYRRDTSSRSGTASPATQASTTATADPGPAAV